jgi:hypothetical protein
MLVRLADRGIVLPEELLLGEDEAATVEVWLDEYEELDRRPAGMAPWPVLCAEWDETLTQRRPLPAYVCPVLGAFVRQWWSDLGADRWRILGRRLPMVLAADDHGQTRTPAVEERRGLMALDWLVRIHLPHWLDLTETLKVHAAELRSLPEIVDLDAAVAARPVTEEAVVAARDAAVVTVRDAAVVAAWATAWATVKDTAAVAAWDAAWDAALDATWDAALDAARAATRDAAWAAASAAVSAAARDALQPTKSALRASALDLLDRMLAVRSSTKEG